MGIQLKARKSYASDVFSFASVHDAKELGNALVRCYEQYDVLEIIVDGETVLRRDRERRYEWGNPVESSIEENQKAVHTVWAWSEGTVVFFTSFAIEYDAMAFATAAMKALPITQIQVESPILGKQTEWKKGHNYYWGDWAGVINSENQEPIAADNV